ncbi:MAG: DUF2782 domain-containing protein [Burkholderiales bacterium]
MRLIVTAVLLGFVLCAAAQSPQRPKDLQPLPEAPPPPPPSDSPLEPEVTIIKRGEQTIEEYRVRGRLYMIKVTPAHGIPYYLMDESGQGKFVRRDGLDNPVKVPLWLLLEF